MERLEGTGASQLVQLIRTIGANTDVTIELATVIAPPPAIRVKLDGVKPLELDHTDVIVAERVTGTNALVAGDRVIIASTNGGQLYVILDRVVAYT